jgi:hypothetical protein
MVPQIQTYCLLLSECKRWTILDQDRFLVLIGFGSSFGGEDLAADLPVQVEVYELPFSMCECRMVNMSFRVA